MHRLLSALRIGDGQGLAMSDIIAILYSRARRPANGIKSFNDMTSIILEDVYRGELA